MAVKASVDTSNQTTVRVGQQNATKVTSTQTGITYATNAGTASNVVGGIASVTSLNVTGVSTFAGITTVTGSTFFAKQVNVSGAVTATSYYGDGSNLTGAGSTLNVSTNSLVVLGISTFNNNIHALSNVGIGTDNPGKTLDIWNTSGAADLRLKTTANSFNSFIFDSARQKDTQFAVIDGNWNGNVVNRIQYVTGSDDTNYDDGYMAFHTRKSGETLSERLRITSDGKIGIGTINPQAKLDVNGSFNVTGVSTLGITSVTDLEAQQLSVSGISTFNDDVYFKGDARNIKWNSAQNDLEFGEDARLKFNDELDIWHGGTHGFIKNYGGDLRIRGDKILLKRENDEEKYLVGQVQDGRREVLIYYNDVQKLATTLHGIEVTGLTSTTDVLVSGAVTATTYYGDGSNLTNTGAVLSAASGSQRLIVSSLNSGIMTTAATDGGLTWDSTTNTLSATNVSIAGTLSYDDVTNVDSVGIVTAGKGLRVTTGGLVVTAGVSTFSSAVNITADSTVAATLNTRTLSVAANHDIQFASGTWSGNIPAKMQHHNNIFYSQGGIDGWAFLASGGAGRLTIDGDGHMYPGSDSTYDLGTTDKKWRNFNVNNVNITGISTFTGDITANGNIVGDNATNITGIAGVTASTLTGTLQTAAQPNITSLGTLTSLDVTGNVSIGGTLTYDDVTNVDSIGLITARQGIHVLAGAGVSIAAGGLNVSSGISTFAGDVDLGNAASDTITALGRFDSDLIPSTGNTRDLGTTTFQWKDIWIDGTGNIDSLNAVTARVGDLTDNRVVIAGASGELEDDANLTFNGSTLSVGVALNISGIATLAGITTVTGDTLFTKQLSVSGFSTYIGVATYKNDVFIDGTLTAGAIDGGTY